MPNGPNFDFYGCTMTVSNQELNSSAEVDNLQRFSNNRIL